MQPDDHLLPKLGMKTKSTAGGITFGGVFRRGSGSLARSTPLLLYGLYVAMVLFVQF